MNFFATWLCAGSLLALPLAIQAQTTPDQLTEWAYPWLIAAAKTEIQAKSDIIVHVPDSDITFTRQQIKNPFFAPDWHPEEHPAMPDIVQFGRQPDVFACGVCHRADGSGGPENTSINGLPVDYIIEQVIAFKNGTRKAAISPDKGPGVLMRGLAKSISGEDIKSAAQYFASIKPRNNIEVIEAEFIPKVKANTLFYSYVKTDEKEALGDRIIEVPNNEEQFENRDTHSRFTAYVPTGSISRGKYLASGTAPENPLACDACHGSGLKGMGTVPRIAGRSPSYLARQLFDIRHGGRTGQEIVPMLSVVEKLNSSDMMALAAYVSSLNP